MIRLTTMSKKITIGLLLGSIGLLFLSCTPKADPMAVSENDVVTVQQGDLIIDITASGNLSLSVKEDLTFEMSGTVEEILVEEGDSVKEGQVLAKLDTSEWEKELIKLERAMLQAQSALEIAEDNMKDTEYTLELALLNAKINLRSAWQTLYNTEESYGNYLNIEISELKVDRAKMERKQAEQDLDELAEELAEQEQKVRLAELALEYAQKDYDEALNTTPEIIAPFDGFVTRVDVEGGDEVLKGKVAVTIADPTKFEAELLVSEMDILQVKLGGKAWIQVDAMGGMSLPAEVTHIAPTATIQQGVVNYKVKVEIESLQPITREQQKQLAPTEEQVQEAIDKMLRGELPDRLKQQIEDGTMTQEQADEMINRLRQGIESGLVTREQVEETWKQRLQAQGGSQRPAMATVPQDFQLRQGLTVTVSILVEERSNVLLVPNRAITRQGQESYVQVLEDGITEQRLIKTGISNWQYTEITSGLSEGDEIVIPSGTTTSSTTSQSRGAMPFLPGGPH